MSDQRFLVTARKYRPQLFGELVAQEHVTGTLKNALRLDRLAHAYLFTGPRGVGKTTAARILAKAINCTKPLEDRSDSAEPCRECESCRSFEEGRNLNIIEIDAASNNKVDDVRDLRETVRIPPQGNRKKVYIVDEVHMLTNQAFNALLKTLEEPPEHVLFIFATTEPHKVLPTIQSRCQRFDFRRIPVQEIVGRLEEICDAEGVSADDGSLMLIARKGDGALRDALSVFDQAVSLCGTNLSQARLVEALGVVSEELFFEVTDHVASRSSAGMLGLVDRVVRSGYDLQEFLDGMAEHLRNLLVAITMNDVSLIEAAEATRERYVKAASEHSETQILRLLSLVDQTVDALRTARQPRLRLEMALVKMAAMPATTDLRAALERLQAAPAEAVQEAKPAEAVAAETAPAEKRPEPAGKAPNAQPAQPKPEQPKPEQPKPEQPKPAAKQEDAPPAEEPERHEPAPRAAPAPPTPSTPGQGGTASPPPNTGAGTLDIFGKPALGRQAISKQSGEGKAQMAEWDDVAVLDARPGVAIEGWETVVAQVMKAKIHLGAMLHHAEAEIRDPGTLTLVVPDELHAGVLRDAHDAIIDGLQAIGRPEVQRIQFEINGTIRKESEVERTDLDPQEALRTLCEEYPAMKLLMERFGGEIVW